MQNRAAVFAKYRISSTRNILQLIAKSSNFYSYMLALMSFFRGYNFQKIINWSANLVMKNGDFNDEDDFSVFDFSECCCM